MARTTLSRLIRSFVLAGAALATGLCPSAWASRPVSVQLEQLTSRINSISSTTGAYAGSISNLQSQMLATITSVTALMASQTTNFYSLKDLGVKADGVTDDSAAMNIAAAYSSASGKLTLFPGGTILISASTYSLPSNFYGLGLGPSPTVIKLADNANKRLIETVNFATLSGISSSVLQPYNIGLDNVLLDCNKSGQTAAPAAGGCFSVAARQLHLGTIRIINAKGKGFYSEGGKNDATTTDWRNLVETTIYDLRVDSADDDNIYWAGPHNARFFSVVSQGSGGWNWKCVDNSNSTGGIDYLASIHTYAGVSTASRQGQYWGCASSRIGTAEIDGDSMVVAATDTAFDKINCILCGQGGMDAISVTANRFSAAQIKLNMSASSSASNTVGLNLGADEAKIGSFVALGNSQEYDALKFSSTAAFNTIGSGYIEKFKGSTAAGTGSKTAVILAGTNNVVNLTGTDNDVFLDYTAGSKNTANLTIFTNTGQVSVSGSVPGATDQFNIVETGVQSKKTWFRGQSGTFAVDSTGVKSVTINHNLLYTPNIYDVQLTLEKNSAVNDYQIGWIRVEAVDSISVTAAVNVIVSSTTGSTTARLGMQVRN